MIIGVPKEIKREEYRVSITPWGVEELRRGGHIIIVEAGAGEGSGFSDEEYRRVGGVVADREAVFTKADLIVKVKEPLQPEYDLMREGQALFTFLHLAPNRELTKILLERKVTAFGYETLRRDGKLPLLLPMSEIAGRMAPLMGAYYLQKAKGGKGVLPTGTTGVKPAKALILGAGVVGTNAAEVCDGLRMETVVMNRGVEALQRIDEMFAGRVKTLPLTAYTISEEIRDADLIIGAVLVPGGKTPVLITRDALKTMEKGTVIVDVSVDQGGCVETSKPTTHDDPVYEVEGILHYSVANMPGAYPRTSTLALTNVTLQYIKSLANQGIEMAIREDPGIQSSLNTYRGEIVHRSLAEAMGVEAKRFNEIEAWR
ncbi:MAG: alanine dehydrogenase [Nitrospirae bacterium]|nr:alanine dehydrogenase [Nitrospirota bacterium]MCL5422814.1 alanine dehydrogenase [Nitrospirota bacterium]